MSSTIRQILRTRRHHKPIRFPKLTATKKRGKDVMLPKPQIKGVILKISTRSPKKPNSAVRKVARVLLSNGKTVWVYIPGIGHNLQEHDMVLIAHGRTQDLIGISAFIIRGTLDAEHVQVQNNSNKKGKK